MTAALAFKDAPQDSKGIHKAARSLISVKSYLESKQPTLLKIFGKAIDELIAKYSIENAVKIA